MKESAALHPTDTVSRHLCRLADRLRPVVVSVVVKRTGAAVRTRPGPVRDGAAFMPRFPVQDRAATGFVLDDEGTIVTAYVNLADAKGRRITPVYPPEAKDVQCTHAGKGTFDLTIRVAGRSPRVVVVGGE